MPGTCGTVTGLDTFSASDTLSTCETHRFSAGEEVTTMAGHGGSLRRAI